jgi:hypothetical protein
MYCPTEICPIHLYIQVNFIPKSFDSQLLPA